MEERPFRAASAFQGIRGFSPRQDAQTRATVWPSASKAIKFGACRSGRQKIEKRSFLEVLALKVPFRNLLVFPNQAPWPGRLRDPIPLNT